MSKSNTVLVGVALLSLVACGRRTRTTEATAAAIAPDPSSPKLSVESVRGPVDGAAALGSAQPTRSRFFARHTANVEGDPHEVAEAQGAQLPPQEQPTVEVPEGGVCGKPNAHGALLLCAAGMQCVSAAAGLPAKCEHFSQASTEG